MVHGCAGHGWFGSTAGHWRQLQRGSSRTAAIHRHLVVSAATAAAPPPPGESSAQTSSTRGIKRRRLGRTDLDVPSVCFGTMLFGESQDYQLAGQLLDECLNAGVNFFDTAEMYPVPQRAETQGLSESYLGKWMKKHSRDKVLIATKVAGPSAQMTWIRGGPVALDADNIRAAIDGSLQRLGTDYIDLYQLHWPDRYVPMFGDVDYDPSCAYKAGECPDQLATCLAAAAVPLEDQLAELGRAVEAGKIRHIGLSNETPWGVMKAIAAAGQPGSNLPRIASIQNAFSLTCRTFDLALSEVCHCEEVSLLAYSPLAMGLLTGKYLSDDGGPPAARLNKYKRRYAEAESRYGPKPNVREAVAAYVALAAECGMTPTALALRFVLQHPLVASAVVGTSNLAQLQELLHAAAEGPLHDPQLLQQLDIVHRKYPNPTP
eukprot:gene6767-6984_t